MRPELRQATRESLLCAVAEWSQRFCVVAPVRRGDAVRFHEVAATEDLDLNFPRAERPAKEVFFPQQELVLSFRKEGEETIVAEPPHLAQPSLVLGLRPCDAHGIAVLDRVFLNQEPKEAMYARRREGSLLIGLGCAEPRPACFCTSMGGGPFDGTHLDILLTPVADRFLLEPTSEAGAGLLRSTEALNLAAEGFIEEAAGVQTEAQLTMERGADWSEGVMGLLSRFSDEAWAGVAEACLGCGACTYLCPSCHCFDLADEGTATRGQRWRCWDTCQFELFTRHASGHNPRPARKDRMRQRILHKWVYLPERIHLVGCTGCGRCVERCPVGLDPRRGVRAVQGDRRK